MADAADMAAGLVDEHLARSLERARVPIPAGMPGECEHCFEDSPRLVNGVCAPCRDGRRRVAGKPLPAGEGVRDMAAAPAPARQWIGTAPAVPHHEAPRAPEQEAAVGQGTRQINVRIGGAALEAIEAGVAAHGTLGASALALIEAGLAPVKAEPAPGALPLEQVHLDALLGELRARFERAVADAQAVDAEALEARVAAAEERAEAAEARLAQLRAVLG